MAIAEKTGCAETENTYRCGSAGFGAEISRALAAARSAHAAVMEGWRGKAAVAAGRAFDRFDAEMARYGNMVERFAKLYSRTGDRDAG